MDILIICLLILATIILLLIELFIVPGISIAGILAGGCAIFANYYAFTHIGVIGGIITSIFTVITCVGSIIGFMRSKTLDRISLKQNITSKIDRNAEAQIKIGDIGITTTRLALIGYAQIKGIVVEVKSTGELLNENTHIQVVRIIDGIILVEKCI